MQRSGAFNIIERQSKKGFDSRAPTAWKGLEVIKYYRWRQPLLFEMTNVIVSTVFVSFVVIFNTYDKT